MKSAAQRTKRAIAIVTFALAGCRAPRYSPTATPEVVPLYFATTQTTSPLLYDLAAAYSYDNNLIAIVESTDIPAFLTTTTLYPVTSTPAPYLLTTYHPNRQLWAAPIGQDGIAIIVNPNLTIPGLTAQDLRDIFTGHVQNWSSYIRQPQKITVISFAADNPTQQAFTDLALGQRQITFEALLATNEQAMLELVAGTPGAIGFISQTALNAQVRVVPIAATADDALVLPSQQTVADESYPLRTPLLIVGEKPPQVGDGYYEFILWAQSPSGQHIIAQTYAPLSQE